MAFFDFHLLKLEHTLVFQIIDQTIFTKSFDQFIASNGWEVLIDDSFFPHIEHIKKRIYLRAFCETKITSLFYTSVSYFDSNEERDDIYNKVRIALKEWALQAREFNEI